MNNIITYFVLKYFIINILKKKRWFRNKNIIHDTVVINDQKHNNCDFIYPICIYLLMTSIIQYELIIFII